MDGCFWYIEGAKSGILPYIGQPQQRIIQPKAVKTETVITYPTPSFFFILQIPLEYEGCSGDFGVLKTLPLFLP